MAVFIGAAATAAMIVGAYGISRIDHSVKNNSISIENSTATDYIYESSEEKRKNDEYDLKHTYYEAGYASPGWVDQEWTWDCGTTDSCPINGGGQPPLYGEHVPIPIGTMGDALDEISWGTGRDASTELELPPERMKTYTCHPLDYGGQLMPHEIPHGAREATDLQFWGPTDWDAERNSRMPSYVYNKAIELDGKEINRPVDDYGWQEFDQDSKFEADDVDYATGQSSARSANVRLMQRNRYGSFVTSRDPIRPKFLPPIPTRARGGGQPGMEPDITFGARLNKVFSAFLGERNMKNKAGPDFAEVTLHSSKLLDYTPRLGNGQAPGGAQPSGPQVNPVQGGRMRRTDDRLNLPMGLAKPRIAASSSLDINPYDGYHYTSRETKFSWENNTIGKSRAGKNGYLLLGNPELEYRQRKEPDDLQSYQNPRGSKGSIYGGEEVHGICIPNVKSSGVTERTLCKGGSRNILGSTGIITLRSNIKNGLKGGDYDDSPEMQAGLINLNTPLSTAIIGGRTKEALDDLFDVYHS